MINKIMIKKVLPLISTLSAYLASVSSVFALSPPPNGVAVPNVQIKPPKNIGIDPTTNPGTILSNALTIAYIAGAILVLFFLVIGAFRWITSGGDKDAVAGARKQIIAALVGLAILALAVVIVAVVGSILNIPVTGPFQIPTLQGPTPTP